MTFNLNEIYFSEKFAICRSLTSKLSENCPNWGFQPFSRLCIISFPWFCTYDKCAWCLVVSLQFASPVNVFLFGSEFMFRCPNRIFLGCFALSFFKQDSPLSSSSVKSLLLLFHLEINLNWALFIEFSLTLNETCLRKIKIFSIRMSFMT